MDPYTTLISNQPESTSSAGQPEAKLPKESTVETKREVQSQPWKQHLDEIKEYNRTNPIDTDLFKASEGFNDHTLAA